MMSDVVNLSSTLGSLCTFRSENLELGQRPVEPRQSRIAPRLCRLQFRQFPAELIHPFRRMYAMFTQFRYTQDLGFGIELTEPTKLLNKPFALYL